MVFLSVVLPTYNRGEKLLNTLNSLLAQNLDRSLWEVVVVNNNSTDNTAQLLSDFVATHSSQAAVRVVTETNQGLSHARNRGIAEALGDIMVFIDDDELVNTDFLREYYNFFESHPDVAVAGGAVVAHFEVEKPKWVTKYTEMLIAGVISYGDRVIELKGGQRPNGGNMAVRRRAFEQYGTYNVSLGRTGGNLLGGEERDLMRRFEAGGERSFYIPNAPIFHCIPQSRWTFDYLRRVAYMVGVSERRRTLNISLKTFAARCGSELYKWCGVVALTILYAIQLSPAKGWSLMVMRWHVTRGLIGF